MHLWLSSSPSCPQRRNHTCLWEMMLICKEAWSPQATPVSSSLICGFEFAEQRLLHEVLAEAAGERGPPCTWASLGEKLAGNQSRHLHAGFQRHAQGREPWPEAVSSPEPLGVDAVVSPRLYAKRGYRHFASSYFLFGSPMHCSAA